MNMYVISIITQNTLCVLQRVAGMFSRYRINIEHINIAPHIENLSYWHIVIHSDDDERINLLVKQVNKIIEIKDIKIIDKIAL